MIISHELYSWTTPEVEVDSLYVDSRPSPLGIPYPSAGLMQIRPVDLSCGRVVHGYYFAVPSVEDCLAEEGRLAEEMRAWDSLSDEALANLDREMA